MTPGPDRLSDIATNAPRIVAGVDWHALNEGEARRMRELGLDDGITVALLHRAPLGGTLACRIGRMTVAMRRHIAHAVRLAPVATAAE